MPNDPGQEVAPTQNRGVAAAFQTDLDAYTPNLMQALPAHVSVEKFKRVLITAVSSNPDLLYANRRTLFTAAVKCASDGLLPDGRDAALVVYNTKVRQRDPNTGLDKEIHIDAVQYLPMVAGIRKRMRNTGDVLSADAHVVYANDKFQFRLGDDGFIEHEPAGLEADPGKPLGAYAIIKLKSGEVLRDVMRYSEIEASRNQGRSKNSLMWTKFWDEGARKTVLKRCAKAAPQSAELEALMGRDEEPPLMPEFEALPPAVAEPEPRRLDFVPEPEPDPAPEPAYTVIDLDGVEHGFREAATAEAALIAVLEAAAKMGLDRLEGAWETNPPFVDLDGQDRPSRRYLELRATLTEPPPKPRRSPPAREAPQPAAEAPPSAPASVAAPVSPPAQQPWPGPIPEAEPPVQDVRGMGHQSPNLAIAPPLRRGLPDWRTWTIALFLPKVRQAKDTAALAYLCGDNDENLEAARASLGKEDLDALNDAIKRRYEELDNAD
jgi:phage RecT family recombinase